MELLDFLRLRWRLFAALFVIGVVAVVLLGRSSGGGDYTARAQLLVQPASDQQSQYGGDGDRFIATEMKLMFLPAVMDPAAKTAGVSSTHVARSLSFTHVSGSDFVTLEVTDLTRAQAVTTVNAVAEAYLADSKSRDLEPVKARQKELQNELDDTKKSLSKANRTVADAVNAYNADNPDGRGQSSETLAPDAYSQTIYLQGRLQILQGQLADPSVAETPEFRSAVYREATDASRSPGWGRTTYLAGVVGWLLVLLAAAGVIVALSRRVLGPARWQGVAPTLSVRRAILLLRGPSTARKDGEERVAQAAKQGMAAPGRTLVAFLPQRSKALSKALSSVQGRLSEEDGDLQEMDSLSDAVAVLRGEAGPDSSSGSTVLLMVDVARAQVADVESLGDLPEAVQRRIVPVLV